MKHLLAITLLMAVGACSTQTEPSIPPVSETSATLDVATRDTVLVIGQQIAQRTFQTLSSNLAAALNEGGVPNAIEFCKIEAMPLTQSVSDTYGVEIRRATHKPRNPVNDADASEMEVIEAYRTAMSDSIPLAPSVTADGNWAVFHAPITIANDLCLKCHGGEGSDISEADLVTIRNAYPDDLATGFTSGELRGIWVVRIPTDSLNAIAAFLRKQ